MKEYEHAMDVYNGKATAVEAEAPSATGGPRVDPEFLRQNVSHVNTATT